MLMQIHWQNKKDSLDTDMRAQREINSKEEMREFIRDAWITQPPPEGYEFLMVEEGSELFVMMKGESDMERPNLEMLRSLSNSIALAIAYMDDLESKLKETEVKIGGAISILIRAKKYLDTSDFSSDLKLAEAVEGIGQAIKVLKE